MTQHTNHYTLTVREVVGKSVKNPNEEILGKVKDILLDTINCTVPTVVMVSGGLFGIGEKQLAVPWDLLHYEVDGDALIMNIDKDFLQRIPAYQGEEGNVIS